MVCPPEHRKRTGGLGGDGADSDGGGAGGDKRTDVPLLAGHACGCEEAARAEDSAVKEVVLAGGGAKKEGKVEVRYEETEKEHVWEFHSEESDEETEARTKDNWKACVLDASEFVYSTLISIPGYPSHAVLEGFQSTSNFIPSVVRVIHEAVCNPKTCFESLVPASTPTTPRTISSHTPGPFHQNAL